MLTYPGHYYRLELAVDSASAAVRDPDVVWLAGPLTAAFPAADVVSVLPTTKGAVAVLSWRGPPGMIAVGGVVEGGIPGLPSMTPEVTSSEARIVAVDDLGLVGAGSANRPALSAGWSLALAVGLLGFVAWSAHQIKPGATA